MKIKTKNQTHEFTDIREKTSKNIWGYYKDHFIQIEKAEKRYQTKEKTVWSVDCTAPDGCYIYNGYFEGTMIEALIDVFRNIEIGEEDMIKCDECDTEMENDDFYVNEENEYINIWICPNCNSRKDIED